MATQVGIIRSSTFIDGAKLYSALGDLLATATVVDHPADDTTVVEVTFDTAPTGNAYLALFIGATPVHYDIPIVVAATTWALTDSENPLSADDVKQLRYRLGIDGDSEAPTAKGVLELSLFLVDEIDSAVVPAGPVNRDWLNQVFGKSNIDKWADLDNTEDDDIINDRIAWAIYVSESEIQGYLVGGPFEWDDIKEHPTIKQMIGLAAGLLLYTPRAASLEQDQANPMRGYEKKLKEFIQRVHAGNFRFQGITQSASAPFVGE